MNGAGLKAFACLCVAVASAAGLLLAVPAVFERALENPTVAAWSPATVDGLYTLVLFTLLLGAAVLGARLSRQRLSVGKVPALGAGLAIGVGGLGAALVLATIAGAARRGDPADAGGVQLAAGALLLLFQTAAEEVYFRGWLQPVLIAGWGRWLGIAVAALAFALLHLINGAASPMNLVNLALAGLCFGVLARGSGGLLLPIGVHFGWDWAAAELFGTAPNPGVGSFGALLNFDLVGSAWWGGSDDGLSSSLAATFALLAILSAALAWPWRRAARRPSVGLRASA
jgi:membrane protease YdiL (CAAX protease family)